MVAPLAHHDDADGPGVLHGADLVGEEAGATIDEHDLAVELRGIADGVAGVDGIAGDHLGRYGGMAGEGRREAAFHHAQFTGDGGRCIHLDGGEFEAVVVRIGHRDAPGSRSGGTRDVGGVPAVARRDGHHHTEPGQAVHGAGFDIAEDIVTERSAEREIHHVEMIAGVAVVVGIGGPVKGLEDYRRRRGAAGAKDFESIEAGFRSHARTDIEIRRSQGAGVGSIKSLAELGHSLSRRDAGHVGAVTVGGGIEGIRIRNRRGASSDASRIVIVAYEIRTADHLGGGKGAGLDDFGVVLLVGRDGAHPAEIGVGIVDAGIDDGDFPAPAGEAAAGQAPGAGGADERGAGAGAAFEVAFGLYGFYAGQGA